MRRCALFETICTATTTILSVSKSRSSWAFNSFAFLFVWVFIKCNLFDIPFDLQLQCSQYTFLGLGKRGDATTLRSVLVFHVIEVRLADPPRAVERAVVGGAGFVVIIFHVCITHRGARRLERRRSHRGRARDRPSC